MEEEEEEREDSCRIRSGNIQAATFFTLARLLGEEAV